MAGDGGDYMMDHSTAILAVDPEGRLRALWSAPHTADGLVADLRRLQLLRDRLDPGTRYLPVDLFRFAAINEQLCRMLDSRVDMVVEPARNGRIQAEIDRDRVRVF